MSLPVAYHRVTFTSHRRRYCLAYAVRCTSMCVAGSGIRFLCQNCVTYPPKPWGNTVIYGDTPKHIVVAGSR